MRTLITLAMCATLFMALACSATGKATLSCNELRVYSSTALTASIEEDGDAWFQDMIAQGLGQVYGNLTVGGNLSVIGSGGFDSIFSQGLIDTIGSLKSNFYLYLGDDQNTDDVDDDYIYMHFGSVNQETIRWFDGQAGAGGGGDALDGFQITDDLTVQGFSATGNVTLGDAVGDSLTITPNAITMNSYDWVDAQVADVLTVGNGSTISGTIGGTPTISGNWINIANPWADPEVSNTQTIELGNGGITDGGGNLIMRMQNGGAIDDPDNILIGDIDSVGNGTLIAIDDDSGLITFTGGLAVVDTEWHDILAHQGIIQDTAGWSLLDARAITLTATSGPKRISWRIDPEDDTIITQIRARVYTTSRANLNSLVLSLDYQNATSSEGNNTTPAGGSGSVMPSANTSWETLTVDITDHTILANCAYQLELTAVPTGAHTTYVAVVGYETSRREY